MTEPEQTAAIDSPTAPPEADLPVRDDDDAVARLPDHLRLLLETLVEKVEQAQVPIDTAVVRRAFCFANEHHAGQKLAEQRRLADPVHALAEHAAEQQQQDEFRCEDRDRMVGSQARPLFPIRL